MNNKPKIVCLCGSTRFPEAFMTAQFAETIAGNIVLTVGCFPRKADGSWDRMQVTDEQKIKLDVLHKQKIDLADEVYVVNVGGYIGDSTRSEIAHAQAHYKPIRWLEPPQSDSKPPDRMSLQGEEFNACAELCKRYRSLPPIVDDDYPEAHHYYESAVRAFLRACKDNGRQA